MRELESSLQAFGAYLLKAQLVRSNAAPYVVRWVRRFLAESGIDTAPLSAAEDALVIDNSTLSLEAVIATVVQRAQSL